MGLKGIISFVLGGLAVVSLHAQDLVRSIDPEDRGSERIIVNGNNPSPYASPNATSATKTDTPVLDIPQSVTVIPRKLIDDQQDITLNEAFRNVASVNTGSTYRDFDQYRIRGFNATARTYLDGLLVDTQVNFQEELFGLERIEVLQGPSSVLYGQSPPGGLVNLISKTPRAATFTNMTLGGGSYGQFEAGLDTNTVLNRSGTIYGRVNLLYRQQGEFADGVDPSERVYFAPSLTVDLTSDTRITFLGQYLHEWQHSGFPLPAIGTVLPNVNGRISIFRNIGEPDTYPAGDAAWRAQLGYQFEHRFNDALTLRQNLRVGHNEAYFRGVFATRLEADQRTLDREARALPERYTNVGVDTSLLARFTTGPAIQHTALAGVDFYYLDDRTRTLYGDIASIDLFHPRYGAQPSTPQVVYDDLTHTAATGIYFQDQIALFDRLFIVGGGRGDFVYNSLRDPLAPPNVSTLETAFSPRAGIVYEVLPKRASAYFSYSRSFLTQPGYNLDINSKPLLPERGEQYEIGVKADAFDGRLSVLLAAYHITRANVPTANADNPNFFDVTGEQRHRGIDFNTNFTPVKGWDFVASYAYIDARVTADNDPARVGLRPRGVPEHTFSLWTKYTLQEGALQGLGIGTGFQYLTEQEGDNYDTFALPSHGVLNLAVYYTHGHFSGQVNINNATDERYYSGSFSRLQVQPGDPISVRSRVGWSF